MFVVASCDRVMQIPTTTCVQVHSKVHKLRPINKTHQGIRAVTHSLTGVHVARFPSSVHARGAGEVKAEGNSEGEDEGKVG